jgi:chorismate synthase
VTAAGGHVLRWSLWDGGALIDGCPPGLAADGLETLSGVFEGRTTGTPIRLAAEGALDALLGAGELARRVIAGVDVRTEIEGSRITCIAERVPAGWGAPVYAKLDAALAAAIGAIEGVVGVEIGDGFAAARLTGSENADPMRAGPTFLSNHAGGILGGISSGQPIVVHVGFHDAPSDQLVEAVAAAMALVLADQKLLHRAQCG